MYDVIARMMFHAPLRHLAAAGLVGVLLTALLPASLNAARSGTSPGGGKTEVLPVQKAAPSVVIIDAPGSEADLRRQLRSKNGVAELGASTSKTMFSQAPTGTFGFILPKFLGLALVTQSPDLALERVSPSTSAYEVHKLADGSGLLVGFMGKDVLTQVAPSQRPKSVRIALHSNPSEKAPHIVAVPLVKLAADMMPLRTDPKNPDSPVVFEMDLQSSSTRASTHGGQ
ncbi:MAG: hypothetical protein LZF60_380043 [Nitrospira sp.]|nr:MAG: hypothetical protein LZF60_380043 [Nitrospira sp.]